MGYPVRYPANCGWQDCPPDGSYLGGTSSGSSYRGGASGSGGDSTDWAGIGFVAGIGLLLMGGAVQRRLDERRAKRLARSRT